MKSISMLFVAATVILTACRTAPVAAPAEPMAAYTMPAAIKASQNADLWSPTELRLPSHARVCIGQLKVERPVGNGSSQTITYDAQRRQRDGYNRAENRVQSQIKSSARDTLRRNQALITLMKNKVQEDALQKGMSVADYPYKMQYEDAQFRAEKQKWSSPGKTYNDLCPVVAVVTMQIDAQEFFNFIQTNLRSSRCEKVLPQYPMGMPQPGRSKADPNDPESLYSYSCDFKASEYQQSSTRIGISLTAQMFVTRDGIYQPLATCPTIYSEGAAPAAISIKGRSGLRVVYQSEVNVEKLAFLHAWGQLDCDASNNKAGATASN